MTTALKCLQTRCFIAGLILALVYVTPIMVRGQVAELATSSEVISEGDKDVLTNNIASGSTWFQIDKLTGDNLAVGDFVVGPGKAEIEVKPGESYIYYITVANRISDKRTFELTVEDIEGSSDASKSVVLLGDEVGPYTLKNYLSFPESTFNLNLGERAKIPVTITVPDDAEPGGYYGSVLVSTIQVNNETNNESVTRSPIIARVGTLFFVTVVGETVRSGETKGVSLKNGQWWYEKGPISFNVLYENVGSVHLNPYGEFRVTNFFGEEVGFVELEPWFVLPKSLRTRELVWSREMLFGRYKATFAINRGYDDLVDERSVVFWVLPWKVLISIFFTVFVLLLLIRLFFRTFEFKRKT